MITTCLNCTTPRTCRECKHCWKVGCNLSDPDQITVVGKPISTGDLAAIITAFSEGGMAGALTKAEELGKKGS